jgi:PAS domain S-box-containing protein
MHKPRILVVEDEALIAASLVHTLTSLGYTVPEPVSTGEDTIKAVTSNPPDLVLMDIELIGPMNGIETAEKIRAIVNIPIVYLTAYSDEQRLLKARLTEPYGFLVKPIQKQELHATIQMALYKNMLDRQLRESEERFRSLVVASPDAIVLTDLEGNVLMPNQQAEILVGYDHGDVKIGTSILKFFPQEEQERLAENIQKTLKQGSIHNVQYTLIKKDGTRVPVELNASVVMDQAGRKQGFVTIVRDITERRRMEEALQLQSSLRQLLMEISSTYINMPLESVEAAIRVSLGDMAKFVGADRAYIFEYDFHKQLCNNTHEWCDKCTESQINEFQAVPLAIINDWVVAHRRGEPIYVPDVHTLPPGNLRDMLGPQGIRSLMTIPMMSENDCIGFVGFDSVHRHYVYSDSERQLLTVFAQMLVNVRNRKLAEAARHESAHYTRNLIEASLDPLVTISPEGKVTDLNAATEQVTGYTRDRVIGTDFANYFTDTKKAKVGYRTVFEDGIVRDYPLEIRHRDGKITPVLYNATIYRDESGAVIGVFAAARDITERKRAEESLHQANKKLTLLYSITRHDITNQLTVLVGYLRILQKKQSNPSFSDYFQKIATAAQRISSMIQFTREYEKIGVNAPVWQDCRTLVDTAAKEAPLGMIKVKNDFTSGAEVLADPLVVKVFYNLMDNAQRYGGKITTIRFSVEERNDDHLFVCEDDGDGVVAEDKIKIFERGFGKNTGLGLALSREILDITGITIHETGEPGMGARFEMMVPKGGYRFNR